LKLCPSCVFRDGTVGNFAGYRISGSVCVLTRYLNKHSTGCEAQLAWKCLFTPSLFRRTILTHKVTQTDLVFGVQWGCISRSVHARL